MKIDTPTVLIVGAILIGLFLTSSQSSEFITGVNSLPLNQRQKVTSDPNYPGWHFWIKYDYFPITKPDVTVVIDTITLEEALESEIAPTNKIIYTMDIRSPHGGGQAFSLRPAGADESGGSMAEIMLTCEHDTDYFNTAWQGYSAHVFKMAPTVGHTYQRKFIVDLVSNPRTIKYYLTDLNTGEQEHFDATLSADTVIGDHLMATSHAVEYHDKLYKSGIPFPSKYKVKTTTTIYK